MGRAIIGILVLAVVVFAIILLRAALESGWNKLANKTTGNAEDKRRQALLGDSSPTIDIDSTRINKTEQRE